MRTVSAIARAARVAALRVPRPAHARYASSIFKMPAMSPTMTEGGIAGWKKQEGESFVAGDVLLEIETDKATIDVEAQDDGILAKIILETGAKNIPVGQPIAVLAEEGDDLSKIEIPKDAEGSAAAPAGTGAGAASEPPKKQEQKQAAPSASAPSSSPDSADHSHRKLNVKVPLAPSVPRLLLESNLSDEQISKIKPTGRHGMLTRGDVLAATGKVKSPYGSAAALLTDPTGPSGKKASEAKKASGASSASTKAAGAAASPAAAPQKPEKPLDGPALRRLVMQGLTKATAPPPPPAPTFTSARITDAEFNSVLDDYAKLLPPKPKPAPVPEPAPAKVDLSAGAAAAAGLAASSPAAVAKDELKGLF